VNAERASAQLEPLPAMRWYEATRHTFASRYVQAGGSLMKLASILGHSATEVTLRYAHLQPGNFTEQERALVDVELAPAKLMPMAGRARLILHRCFGGATHRHGNNGAPANPTGASRDGSASVVPSTVVCKSVFGAATAPEDGRSAGRRPGSFRGG